MPAKYCRTCGFTGCPGAGGKCPRWPAREASLIGRRVQDAYDDSPCPVTGTVVGQIDAETLEVRWDGSSQIFPEPFDALRGV